MVTTGQEVGYVNAYTDVLEGKYRIRYTLTISDEEKSTMARITDMGRDREVGHASMNAAGAFYMNVYEKMKVPIADRSTIIGQIATDMPTLFTQLPTEEEQPNEEPAV